MPRPAPFTVGKLRYANNSNYKNDVMIRKEVMHFPVHAIFSFVLREFLPCIVVVGVRSQERDGGAEEDH